MVDQQLKNLKDVEGSKDLAEKCFGSVKGAAIDMDGTLLDPDHKVHAQSIAAIKSFEEKVGMVMICTGRNRASAQSVVSKDELDLYARPGVYSNGAIVVGEKGDFLYQATHSSDTVVKCVEWIINRTKAGNSKAVPVLVVGDEYWVMDKSGKWDMHLHYDYHDLAPHQLDEDWRAQVQTMKVSMVHCICPEEELADGRCEDVRRQMQEIAGDDAHAYKTLPTAMSLSVKGVSKAHGLRKLFELAPHLGLDIDSVMGIGDSGNDVELVKECKVGVCMKNATEPVKAVADIETDYNYELGVAKVLNVVSGLSPK